MGKRSFILILILLVLFSFVVDAQDSKKQIVLEETKEVVLEELESSNKTIEEKKDVKDRISNLFDALLSEVKPIAEDSEEKLCGNGLIDIGESCNNCKDAICSIDQYCDSNAQCVPKSNMSSFFKWVIIILIFIPSLVYVYYHAKKREVSKQDIIMFVIALLFIIFSLIILYLNISTISLSLLNGVDHSAAIIIESDVNNRLYELYQENGNVEFVACLKGKYSNKRYQIYDIEEIKTITKSVAAVESQGCSKINNIGTIHSHPEGLCEPSKQDIYTFGQKNDLIMGIMCSKDKYGFYTKKNFERSMFYIIKDAKIKEESKNNFSYFYLSVIIALFAFGLLIIRFKDNILDFLRLLKKKKYPNLIVAMGLMNKTEKLIVNKLMKTDGMLKEDLINKLGLSKVSFNDAVIRLERSSLIVVKKEKTGERIYLSDKAKR
ncbi:hypothetical protein HYX17_04140 [Candidatus Woesearchaeota archaeon]|nr:hypothetical protein [Candidatus Woesearchaeota archaeon]